MLELNVNSMKPRKMMQIKVGKKEIHQAKNMILFIKVCLAYIYSLQVSNIKLRGGKMNSEMS